jgi:hypothetical protein
LRTGAAILFAGFAAAALFACGKPPGGGLGSGGTKFGGPGPWGADNRIYGAADGILETPVVGISTDESQNLWVATNDALYLLTPGEKTFRRFDAHDGLHLPGNAVTYCDSDFAGGDRACPIRGAAAGPGFSEITGGGPDEVFVGYFGIDDGSADWSDPNRHSGKLDRVRLSANGSLSVDRFDLVSSTTAQFWHNRTVQRLLYDHFKHPHELYAGTNHGVDRFQPDRYRAPNKGEWFLAVANEFMSDHLHPQVCYHHACDATETDLRLGDWRGLALSAGGNLWVGGRWTGGEIRWTAGLSEWLNRPGSQIFAAAFGDPYVAGRCNGDGFCNQPVFLVPQEGDVISVQAVAVAPDGRAWFASGRSTTSDTPRGLAVWNGTAFKYYDPQRDLGMAESDLRDLLALPDGRLVVAGARTGITIWDPKSGAHTQLRGVLPDENVLRMELDTMVEPPTLHVATYSGAAAIRKLP